MTHKQRLRAALAISSMFTEDPPEPLEWMERFVKFPKGAKGENFDANLTPWIREPIYRACIGIWTPSKQWVEENSAEFDNLDIVARLNSFMKPVQTGGSAAGEAFLLYCLRFARGFMQYNWSNDKRAKERWNSRIQEIIEACTAIMDLIAELPKKEATKMEIDLGRIFFRMQGVYESSNLDSDTINVQINEEIHSWEPGHLKKARGRSTAVERFKGFDISNASKAGDQWTKAFDAGTQQRWQVRCPGCGKFHVMRTRWDKKNPKYGGLRYDGDKARRPGGLYNYNIIRDTIRFQMPCGYVLHNDRKERRVVAHSGKYTLPVDGSDLTHRSYTYEAVMVDYIDWVMLVQEKHEALRALRLGDPSQWIRYVTERECLPYDANDNPVDGGYVVLQKEIKLNRDGLPHPKLRLFSLDRQQGNKALNEFPHWWLVIRDVQVFQPEGGGPARLRSRLVFEGKVETDENVIKILDEHQCVRHQGVADSGDDTTHVYLFCLKYGINAIKGGKSTDFYVHPNGARRVYSPERPLHTMLNREPKYPYLKAPKKNDPGIPDPREPLFWLYSKIGIRERFHWLRTSTIYETPMDVSETYQKHLDSEERVKTNHPTTNEEIYIWVQRKTRNDLFVCECYIAMQIDQAGLILQEITTEGIYDESAKSKSEPSSTSDNGTAIEGEGFNSPSDGE